MSPKYDILLPTDVEPVRPHHKSRFAAFVPITLALIGIAAILFGGVSARSTDTAARQIVDPITTGSLTK